MTTKFMIEKFNGSNFSLWKLKIRTVLRKENCLDAIDGRPDLQISLTKSGKRWMATLLPICT